MLRILALTLSMLGASLLTAGPALADNEITALRDQVASLQRQADTLEGQRELLFRKEVESYLNTTEAYATAQGGSVWDRVRLDAYLTGTFLATIGSTPGNTHAAQGLIGLAFEFDVTDNLNLFIKMTANNPGAGFPAQFGPIAGSAGATMSGMFDGIGVDGTVSTAPGSVRLDEGGITLAVPITSKTLYITAGKLDPRNYYAQNAFAGDNHTQFLNNLFNDPPALNWRSNAAGAVVYGLELSIAFGPEEQYRCNAGWYNSPGRWFDQGLFLYQFTWTTKVAGREMNTRVYGQLDTMMRDVSAAVGVSWDWYATDKIGVFFRATVKDNQSANNGETNHVESDWQGGVVFYGLVPKRPDDSFGIAIGHIKGPIGAVIPGSAGNSETPIELYYTFVTEGGKLQITGVFQYIIDPGAGNFAGGDDLVLLGVRVHVPF